MSAGGRVRHLRLFVAPSPDATPFPNVSHHAPCGTCGRLLDITESELLTSLEHPLVCWTCDST